MMKKTLCMMGVALGLLASSAYATSSDNNYLNVKNASQLIQTYNTSLAHRFDTVRPASSVGLKTVLNETSYDPAGVPTQANVSASDNTCVVDVNLAQLKSFLKEGSFSNEEINIFVKFAILHERFHCVVFDDKESMWLPGAHSEATVTEVLSEHRYSLPATMLTPHANAYEFIHESLADGMALIATLQEMIPQDHWNSNQPLSQSIPKEYHAIIQHIITARLNSTVKAGDAHGTFRMLDFVLTQPTTMLNKPLSEWYSTMKQEAGVQLFEAYHRDGMDSVLTERDMAYNYQASVVSQDNQSLNEHPKTWMQSIVQDTKRDLLQRGIVDHSNARKIQQLIQGNTQHWVNTVEWRYRSEELEAINTAFRKYTSNNNLEALTTQEGQSHYFESRGLR